MCYRVFSVSAAYGGTALTNAVLERTPVQGRQGAYRCRNAVVRVKRA
jgi:hypothetical protein